jgi:hypothetical protein
MRKLTLDDFEQFNTLGEGAFGKVKLVSKKDGNVFFLVGALIFYK